MGAPWEADYEPLLPPDHWTRGAKPEEAIEPEVEAFARKLCEIADAKPDEIIGFPPAPRWRSWAGYARKSVQALHALGYRRLGQ